eukprot:3349155-Amphidinium_carterae.1
MSHSASFSGLPSAAPPELPAACATAPPELVPEPVEAPAVAAPPELAAVEAPVGPSTLRALPA